MKTKNDNHNRASAGATGSAVICDIIGCHEHATVEVQVGDEYIPLCEMHRKSEMDRLMPKWRPLPPNDNLSDGGTKAIRLQLRRNPAVR